MTKLRIATCNCGDLRAECKGEPDRISVCHCRACKRRTGSAFSFNATFAREQVFVTGAVARFERTLDAGHSTYSFCPSCGSTVFYEITERPGQISVPAGAFADPEFEPPSVSVCAETQNRWVTVHLGGTGAGAELREERRAMPRSDSSMPTIARIWRGRTRRDVADAYEAYNYEAGIVPLIEKAMGVQTFREDRPEESEFMTISYWASLEDMTTFSGKDPTAIHHLPRDAEFLIELPTSVQVLRLLTSHGATGSAG